MKTSLLLLIVAVLVSQMAYAQPATLTTLSVVLLTFPDDTPHGYTRTRPAAGMPSRLVAGDHAYTLNDFERKFGVLPMAV